MLLYQLDVQIKRSHHGFRLWLDADNLADDKGDWAVSAPGDLYLGQLSGVWRVTSIWRGSAEYLTIRLMNKSIPGWWGTFKEVFTLSIDTEFPKELAALDTSRYMGVIDKNAFGNGATSSERGSWPFTWKLAKRFF